MTEEGTRRDLNGLHFESRRPSGRLDGRFVLMAEQSGACCVDCVGAVILAPQPDRANFAPRRSTPRTTRGFFCVGGSFGREFGQSYPLQLESRVLMLSGTSHRPTALERPFELAQSGRARGIEDLVRMLKHEGYSTGQIQGPSLRRQLSDLIKAARSESSDTPRT